MGSPKTGSFITSSPYELSYYVLSRSSRPFPRLVLHNRTRPWTIYTPSTSSYLLAESRPSERAKTKKNPRSDNNREMDMQSDFDRIMFFEHARKTFESTYTDNPQDSDNLTKWGGALLELSQSQDAPDAKKMIAEAVSKLQEALTINPRNSEALWYLGNAHTSHAFMTPDVDEARVYFDKATSYFLRASKEDPTNELYHKSLEIAAKAPDLHMEIYMRGSLQQATGTGSSTSTSSKQQSLKKKRSSDLKYDIFGWIILAVGIVAWVGFAKTQVPPPAR